MYLSRIFSVTGQQSTYRLRRVQSLMHQREDASEEITAILQACITEEQLLDFFFTTDYPVNEAFILLFEKRMKELQSLSF